MTIQTPKEIAVRCYTEEPPKAGKRKKPRTGLDEPSDFTLVFDCETTTDEVQALRFGFYQVREGLTLYEQGIFYCAKTLTESEISLLTAFADEQGYRAISVEKFRTDVFLKVAYHWGGLVVGFNLTLRYFPYRYRPR